MKKVGFYYHMQKGKETAESFIELPVSEKRYKELLLNADNKESVVCKEVGGALKTIARLQGYTLTGFVLDFTIKAQEGSDE